MGTKPVRVVGRTTRKEAKAAEAPGARKRGAGDTVALTVRLPRAEWARLHHLAVAEGVSLQTLAVRGFDKVFADYGLRSIRLDAKAL